jgi:hypothetical protein
MALIVDLTSESTWLAISRAFTCLSDPTGDVPPNRRSSGRAGSAFLHGGRRCGAPLNLIVRGHYHAWLAAFLALITEGMFAVMAYATGWGPCGPGTLLGVLGLIAHAPSLLVIFWLKDVVTLSDTTLTAIAICVGLFVWFGLYFALLDASARRQQRAP